IMQQPRLPGSIDSGHLFVALLMHTSLQELHWLQSNHSPSQHLLEHEWFIHAEPSFVPIGHPPPPPRGPPQSPQCQPESSQPPRHTPTSTWFEKSQQSPHDVSPVCCSCL